MAPAGAAPAHAADAGRVVSPVGAGAVVARRLTPAQVLQLQRTVGNRAVGRLLAGTVQREEESPAAAAPPLATAALEEGAPDGAPHAGAQVEDPGVAPELPEEQALDGREAEPPALAVGGGHHVTVREVDGVMRLGVASDFTQAAHIVAALLAGGSPLTTRQRARVRGIRDGVNGAEARMNRARAAHTREQAAKQALRRLVTRKVKAGFGVTRFTVNRGHPRYRDYTRAMAKVGVAWEEYLAQERAAVALAKDSIVTLWDIGKDFLPTHLMPVGEVFRDKADFGGDTDTYTYHRGTATDPIPITWYKDPADYPRLRLQDGTVVNFGAAFTAGGMNFGLAPGNVPQVGWAVRKQAHNETREGQQLYNRALVDNGVEVEKNGAWRTPPLGNTHQFDGDHVKDLGFGGADQANNYWPLDSTINRRAFTGYNSAYVVHYINERNEHKSRAIGGLVGKWFRVRAFLDTNDGPVPDEGEAAGGT